MSDTHTAGKGMVGVVTLLVLFFILIALIHAAIHSQGLFGSLIKYAVGPFKKAKYETVDVTSPIDSIHTQFGSVRY